MTEKNETLRAALRETPGNASAMREALVAARDLLLPQCNGGTAFAKACGETVNKIMDALKEERTSDCNAAALRDALLKAIVLLKVCEWPDDTPMQEVAEVIDEIEKASSATQRNCDRFGGDINRLREACLRERGLNPEEDFPDVFCEWLLSKAKGRKP